MWKLITIIALQANPSEAFFPQRVDFWRDGTSIGRPKPALQESPHESIWAEPIRLPDGRYATYVPPKQVMDFLEDPTPESGRKYLEWQTARLEKMRKAALILAEMERESFSAPLSEPISITYFKKAG